MSRAFERNLAGPFVVGTSAFYLKYASVCVVKPMTVCRAP
jgi:hypothetical protein